MRIRFVPAPFLFVVLATGGIVVLLALLVGVPVALVGPATALGLAGLTIATILDWLLSARAWRRAQPRLLRRLPSAFAIGVERPISIAVETEGHDDWRCELHDYVDPSFRDVGLPLELRLVGGRRVETSYLLTPTRRGEVRFAPAALRVRSRWRLCDLNERLGEEEVRRVYPDFAQVARYAWLAGDRRLQEIGIKTFQQRGEGTDFKQLAEYRPGDAVRHIDWKATLRFGKPIVREFQDERDQTILLLIDCGRRMRADDRQGGVGTAHFDQVLNAVMLLSYVALRQGDAVGALTFGTPAGAERLFPPRKGAHALNALMADLCDVQPTPTHSDYVAAAENLLRRYGKRALVIVITNFRDEDSSELGQALRLLRSRHLVLLASLREKVVAEMMGQPIVSGDAALDVASAHLYEQARRDAFNRLAARDALMVDADPARLGAELVNRYHAVKRAGLI